MSIHQTISPTWVAWIFFKQTTLYIFMVRYMFYFVVHCAKRELYTYFHKSEKHFQCRNYMSYKQCSKNWSWRMQCRSSSCNIADFLQKRLHCLGIKSNVAHFDTSSSELLCQWKVCSPSHITGNPVSPEEVVGAHSNGVRKKEQKRKPKPQPKDTEIPKIVFLSLLSVFLSLLNNNRQGNFKPHSHSQRLNKEKHKQLSKAVSYVFI